MRTLHSHDDAVGLTRVDGFAGLLDLLQHGLVGDRVFGRDVSGLGVERHGVFFHT